ncbi:hypothetical protein COHA_004068 [Chlorella ohadii]|uniref:Uncharacterized protein n=1 Tax=Chlorella ohadii TaxID=2649997 RepID=A0AAD5DY06_9CHLO|nr:hypothetical protein COHA_004068 [Chlorella ohadii]
MAAPKAVAVFSHLDVEYVVEPLCSSEAAALVCDALTIKEAMHQGQDLSQLQLRSMLGPPRLELLDPQYGDAAANASFEDIVEQLNDCAIEAAGEEQPEPGGQGLVLAALTLEHNAAVQLLLATAPSLALADGALDIAVHSALEYAAHSRSALVALLLAALPDPRAAVEAVPVYLVHDAAGRNGVELLQQLLEVAPRIATAIVGFYTTAMWAAACGCSQALAVLIEFCPEASTAANEHGQHPLHSAAQIGSTACLKILLAAAPQLAAAVDEEGWTAAHVAAKHGRPAALELLLRRVPETVSALTLQDASCMFIVAGHGHVAVVQLLLAATPHTAQVADDRGFLPAHVAAEQGHSEVLRLLLDAAPACALARNEGGWLPAHMAAMRGEVPCLSVLLAAAPAAAGTRSYDGHLPIDTAIELLADPAEQHATVRALLPYGDARAVLRALRSDGQSLAPLFAEFVLARLPLTPTIRGLLPAQCPGLGRALPAALEHSIEQAASLVRHLPAADRLRLHTAARCLARAQRRLRTHLPQPVLWKVLSMFEA